MLLQLAELLAQETDVRIVEQTYCLLWIIRLVPFMLLPGIAEGHAITLALLPEVPVTQ